MAFYKYTAMSGTGRTVRGNIRADSLQAFYAELESEELYCLKAREISETPSVFIRLFGKRILSKSEMAVFFRQMASMTASGVTINRCLDVLYCQSSRHAAKGILHRLYEDVQKGNQLSSAMADIDGAFEPLAINMVRAGESSGTFDRAFSRLADYYEREIMLKNKIMLALLYPIILAIVALMIIVVLFVVVLPSFATLFNSMESLPWYTRALMSFSDFLVYRWYAVLTIIFAAVLSIALFLKNTRIKASIDHMILRIPFIGRLQTQILCARFCRVFASLYTSGVQILTSLQLSSDILSNSYIKSAVERAASRIKTGISLSMALKREKIFPHMMITMFMVGEESGELNEMLLKTSEYYDNEADAAIQKLIGMLQPVMIVILGIFIAFVMISVLQPIYTMYQNI